MPTVILLVFFPVRFSSIQVPNTWLRTSNVEHEISEKSTMTLLEMKNNPTSEGASGRVRLSTCSDRSKMHRELPGSITSGALVKTHYTFHGSKTAITHSQ